MKKLIIIFTVIFMLIVGCYKKIDLKHGKIRYVKSITDLDNMSEFKFAIFSDNKGDSNENSKIFFRMKKWIKKTDDKFVIGLGDHLKKGWNNSFLKLIKEDIWWNENFYPNIADGENQYYGKGQGDWGAGGKLLDILNMSVSADVNIRKNGCEYYLKRKIGDFTIHLIQLHFSDEPKDTKKAFKKDSKDFMFKTLQSIQKSQYDIVIVGSHSRKGFWDDELDKEQFAMLMKKADLVLSATTHFFKRKVIKGHENDGPLFLNTGSITYPYLYSPFGYIQVNILKYPNALVLQYMNAGNTKRELQPNGYAFIKIINGKIIDANLRKLRIDEDINRIVATLNDSLSKESLNKIATKIYEKTAKTTKSHVEVFSSLKAGNIRYKELWNVFPYNNEICRLKMDKQTFYNISKETIKGDSINIAISKFSAKYLIRKYEIPKKNLLETGKEEIELLDEYLNKISEKDFLN